MGTQRHAVALLERAVHIAVATAFAMTQAILEAVARVYFQRIETVERDRFPRRRPALMVANHPAAWTDVLVLDVALDRKIHFITLEPLFHPWMRGLLLRLFGSLPIRFGRTSDALAENEHTFGRCRELLRRGEVVAFFPEGVSSGDRSLQPLKTGAARLMLGAMAGDGGELPMLVPVALHYEDRTAFRTNVVVMVGGAIAVDAPGPVGERRENAVHALTDRIARALTELLEAAARHSSETARRRAAAAAAPRFWAEAMLSGTAAAGGIILHAIPLAVIETAAQSLGPSPQQIALGRIIGGLMLLPLWYLALGALATHYTGQPWIALSAPLLGAWSCRELDRRRARATGSALTPEGTGP